MTRDPKQNPEKVKKTVNKLSRDKDAPVTDNESKALQKLGRDMSAPNDNPKKDQRSDNHR